MRQYKREPLRNGEADRLLAAAETDLERAAIGTLLETGCRLAEFCALKPEAVNWAERRMRVHGKGDVFRVIPLSELAVQSLELWFKVPMPKGKAARERAVQRAVKRVASRAGFERPVFCHILRHSFAVTCLRRGIDIRTLQLLLGHQSLDVTSRYLNLAADDVCQEFEEKWR